MNYWIRLEELGGADHDIRSLLDSRPSVDRRSFLKLVGVSLAAGALSGCRRPVETILPHLVQPVEITPSVANWYATTCHGCSAACGALAKVVNGRPIKFEGNPEHGVSRGGLCAVGQASVLSLYDSYRQKTPTIDGKASAWEQVDQEIVGQLRAARRVVLLTNTVTGPASRAAIATFLKAFPGAEHVVYDAISHDAIRAAHAAAYGEPFIPGYSFERAAVIVALGADFLGSWLSPVAFTKQYAAGRTLSPDTDHSPMSRHYQFESRMSLTGSNADHRFAIAPSEQAAIAASLLGQVARALAGSNPAAQALAGMQAPKLRAELEGPVARVVKALVAAPGQSLVVSDSEEVVVQTAVLALNELLGDVGRSVDLNRPLRTHQGDKNAMARLIARMGRGEVDALLIHGCNPAFASRDADAFVAALKQVTCAVSFAVAPDETAAAVKYHCPTHHPIEAWGDAEPQAGRYTLFQPTVRPLYATRAFEESLLRWSGHGAASAYDHLRRQWQTTLYPRQTAESNFDAFWDGMLQRGYLELPAPLVKRSPIPMGAVLAAVREISRSAPAGAGEIELDLHESVALRDGAAANNPWLQELPDPITKIAWDNCALIAPSLAREKGIQEGQWIRLDAGDRSVTLPAHLQPGQHPRTISVALGYGRTHAGPVGNGVGINAYPVMGRNGGRCSVAPGPATNDRQPTISEALQATELGRQPYRFARPQIHDSLEGRRIVQETTLADLGASSAEHERGEPADLWPGHAYPEQKWGMAIDLTKCVGCSACVTACDIENNVPVVGRDEVGLQREMHWLRIDRYFGGDPAEPTVVHQPMLCQHCENATCEVVCPVLATVHDDQGLNVQVYNRCVGTRYCANNCPYKVRHFNFYENVGNGLTQNLVLNPDVTVRSRGIMEKCSFCVQRIQSARADARREGRAVTDGEVRTACEQSCPADAIVFGNLADPNSRVSKLAASERGYRVLEELNRRPSVIYLSKVRNIDEEEA